jgi:cation diffusion facilitator CzcD-associated flavoprotein CzcO
MASTATGGPSARRSDGGDAGPDYEAIVLGAGICGIYEIYLLTKLGMRATVLEAADGIGGNWYANRYPGCRFDSESYSYGYSFSQELLDEWSWSQLFAPQAETLSYLEHVVDKFDLRRHIHTSSRVAAAHFDETTAVWTVETADGRTMTTRWLLTALGLLTIPAIPDFAHREAFRGRAFHTHDWPHEGVDLRDKRVAVIGTGSSGVQVISAIAGEVGHLTVYQRNPNWCAPLNNRPIDVATMADIRSRYDEIFARCKQTPGGFLHGPDPRYATQLSEEERLAFWEELYEQPGFGIWLGNFRDTGMDETANALLSEFVAGKIRSRVHDPAVADKLIPKDHGFGTKRVPLETGYYEVYNQPNVELIDLKEDPIERFTETGIRSRSGDREFDVIVYATGYDAVTGAFDRIDFTGLDGLKLRDKWADGPVTYLGLQVAGFPNLFMLSGPQSGSGSTNFPRGIEEICDWTTALLEHATERGVTRIEARPEAEQAWLEHVKEQAQRVLMSRTRSWTTGYSAVRRPEKPRYMLYLGGMVRFRRRLEEQAAAGYPAFILSAEDGITDRAAATGIPSP